MVEAKGDAGEISGRVLRDVSEGELRVAFTGPAIFSNKFYATNGPSGIRIAFMESLFPIVHPIFRAAVLLPYQDAIALRDLLTKQLKEIEPLIQRAEEASSDPAGRADAK
jgi:hypothetical protein